VTVLFQTIINWLSSSSCTSLSCLPGSHSFDSLSSHLREVRSRAGSSHCSFVGKTISSCQETILPFSASTTSVGCLSIAASTSVRLSKRPFHICHRSDLTLLFLGRRESHTGLLHRALKLGLLHELDTGHDNYSQNIQ
jgi:hypothetical protein